MKPVREPDAVEPHVRFDERRWETEPRSRLRHRHLAKAAGHSYSLGLQPPRPPPTLPPLGKVQNGEARELRIGSPRRHSERLQDLPDTARIARACLTVLRHLATEPAISPHPMMISDGDKVAVPVLKDACRLVGGEPLRGYYIAMADEKNPYMGLVGITSEKLAGMITLDVPHGFRAVTSAEIANR